MEKGGLRLRDNGTAGSLVRKPLISIVTIVRNGERYIEQAMLSVVNQKSDDVEYLLIDGGSTDATLSIIKKYEQQIDFWLSEKDEGISDGFNKGFRYSSGKFIAYLNSDDWYEPGVLSRVAADLKNEEMIYCGHMNLRSIKNNKILKLHKSRPERIFQTMRIAHPASFVPRRVFEETGGFDLKFRVAMDFDFMMRACLAGFKFNVLPYVITNHRRGGNSNDVFPALHDELLVKNQNLGNRIGHWIWYYINTFYFRIFTPAGSEPADK